MSAIEIIGKQLLGMYYQSSIDSGGGLLIVTRALIHIESGRNWANREDRRDIQRIMDFREEFAPQWFPK